MTKLLNRGLNYAVLPLKLDITEVLTDFRRFERRVIWKEFWFNKETTVEKALPIFKQKKTNMPKDHQTPKALKVLLNDTPTNQAEGWS